MTDMTPPALDDLDAAYASVRRDPYRFQWAGQQWQLPHIAELDYRLQAEIESLDGVDTAAVESLFRRCFGTEQAARWTQVEVPLPVLFMLFDRWLKFCGAEMGEPPASNGSSANTGEKSRPTSDTTTGSASPKRSSGRKRAPRTATETPPVVADSPPENSST